MSKGIGIVDVVQIVFIILKLTGLVNWSWVVVFLPTLIVLGVMLIILIVFIIYKIIEG